MSQTPKQLARINLRELVKQPNPQIDLQIPIYESSALSFMRALTTHKQRIITQHSGRLDHLDTDIRRTNEKSNAQGTSIRKLKIQEGELKMQLQREAQERHEAEVVVLTLQRQLACLKDSIAAVEAEHEYQVKHIQDLKRERASETEVINSHCTANVELAALMAEKLGCTIQGITNQDKCSIISFRNLHQEYPEREIFFVLDSSMVDSGGPYRVLCSFPSLPSMALLVTALNASRDLNAFIKACREAYHNLLNCE
ncbi:hypothetical protein BJ165DRAFT_1605512 [Panaeolus papilionaceus]|nr:hypothetical protein BJ165DRAFT_1605512 [Panaeolus papilionaceus]